MAQERFVDKTVAQFLDELASRAPVPGGGSGAALGGALAAGLASMVCNLTIGTKKYADVQGEIQELLGKSEALRKQLMELLQADTEVYLKISTAYKMPRETDEEKAKRTEAIQAALVDATDVPMRIAHECVGILDICTPIAEKGNVGAVSDAGVAALLAEASLRSAALNVMINLAAIKDESFVSEKSDALNRLLDGSVQLKEDIVALVESKL